MRSVESRFGGVWACALFALVLVVPAAAGDKKRDKHVEEMPRADLTAYSTLYLEDFTMTDPKADKRKKQDKVEGVTTRLPNRILENLRSGVFDAVKREPAPAAAPAALVLRAEITQYKPGSKGARFMMAGAGSAHIDLMVHLVDAASGRDVLSFPVERTWAWGGAMGGSKGIEDMERNLGIELAKYLARCKGVED